MKEEQLINIKAKEPAMRLLSSQEEAVQIMKELRAVVKSGTTRNYSWRLTQLKSLLTLINENESQICDALYSDLKKPNFEVLMSEVAITKGSCKLAIKELKKWMKPEKVKATLASSPCSTHIRPEPLGVVLILSTWNYPFMLAVDPIVGAIAAGNAVVLKPSEVAPATSALLARMLPKYLDSTAIQVVEGGVEETTLLLGHQWDKIFYTGNAKVGLLVMGAAARHLTPVVLELGGKSPVVVDSNINLDVAVKRIASGKWGCNNGQACIAPDYVITTKAFAPQLVEAFKSCLTKFYGENPADSEDLSRVVNSCHYKRLVRLLDEEEVGNKIVLGGQRDEVSLYIAPTILLNTPLDSSIMNEEIFGPLLPIVTVENLEESFDIIESKPKPLAAYLFTNDKMLQQRFVEKISAGGILINDTILHLATPTLPFGGVGESGMGCYHGKFSFETFSHRKALMIRGFGGDANLRYPPFTEEKKILLKHLLNEDIPGFLLVLGLSALAKTKRKILSFLKLE